LAASDSDSRSPGKSSAWMIRSRRMR